MLLVATTLQLVQMLIVAKPSTNAWLLYRQQDLVEGNMPEVACTSRFLLTALSLMASLSHMLTLLLTLHKLASA
jgi:hypothetical protein